MQSSDSTAPAAITTDSAGMRIVTTVRTEWADPVPIDLPEPLLRLPSVVDASATPLSRVLAAERLADGRIAVLDGQQERIIFYDELGSETSTFGGQGAGPGEFRQAVSLQEGPAASVEVYDLQLNRLTEILGDGTLGRVETLSEAVPRPRNVWRLQDGSLVMWSSTGRSPDRSRRTGEAEVVIADAVLVRGPGGAQSTDTLFHGPAWSSIRRGDGQGTTLWEHAFGATTEIALGNGGRRLFLTTNRRHEIDVLDLEPDEGDARRARFRFPELDGPVPEAELAALQEQTRRALAEESAPFLQDLDFLYDPRLQPGRRPAFRKLLIAPDGTIWAQRFEPLRQPAPFWWIISPEGVFRGLVELPARTDILSFSDDLMLLLRLDEYDVPSVEVVPIPQVGREPR